MIFKNYKQLYEQSLNNNKVLNERNQALYKDFIKHQENAKEMQKKYKSEIVKLKFELEDTQGFLQQAQQCCTALRKERKALKERLAKYEPIEKKPRKPRTKKEVEQ